MNIRRTRAASFALIVSVMLLQAASSLQAQGRNYARSVVITRQGIVAASQALASEAGVQVLLRGGSAVDASIAANAVLAVTEPDMNGIGGDLFALYWESKTGKLTGLNASGPAPGALTPEFLRKAGYTKMATEGIHSVTIPGAVDGWAKMHARYGKLPWRELFQYAIAYADQGFPVPEVIQEAWSDSVALKKVRMNPESLRVFLPGGQPPKVGMVFRNPDLARALRLISEKGRDAFYKGEIADAILKTSQQLGGTMTADDLTGFSSEWVQPISTEYRGWRVYELPPNGQGMAGLEMLNIMETSAVPDVALGSAEIHKRIEAMKLAYADLQRYDADPRTSRVPVAALISKQYARKRALLIDAHQANCEVTSGQVIEGDTVYLTVVDREGNIASWIQSIADNFGSGVTVSNMGFILQNRGWGFTLDPNHPNVLAGGNVPSTPSSRLSWNAAMSI